MSGNYSYEDGLKEDEIWATNPLEDQDQHISLHDFQKLKAQNELIIKNNNELQRMYNDLLTKYESAIDNNNKLQARLDKHEGVIMHIEKTIDPIQTKFKLDQKDTMTCLKEFLQKHIVSKQGSKVDAAPFRRAVIEFCKKYGVTCTKNDIKPLMEQLGYVWKCSGGKCFYLDIESNLPQLNISNNSSQPRSGSSSPQPRTFSPGPQYANSNSYMSPAPIMPSFDFR